MKKILLFSSIIFLSGCSIFDPFICKEPQVITKIEYVKREPDPQLLVIPPRNEIPQVNELGEMLQSDISKWILLEKKRTVLLEGKIEAIKEFLDQPID